MTVVLQIEPIWGNAASVMALYGVPRRRLLELAKAGTIRARKMDPESRTSAIVFRMADIKDWLENEAAKPRLEPFEATHVKPAAAVAEPACEIRPPHALHTSERGATVTEQNDTCALPCRVL